MAAVATFSVNRVLAPDGKNFAFTVQTVDIAQNKVTAPLRHFSSYGVARGGKAGW